MKLLFKPKQRIEMLAASKKFGYPAGTRATVVMFLPSISKMAGKIYYGIIMDDGRKLRAQEHEMRPIYDGDQSSTWADCAWQPRKESA
jgi:hypothetical protein